MIDSNDEEMRISGYTVSLEAGWDLNPILNTPDHALKPYAMVFSGRNWFISSAFTEQIDPRGHSTPVSGSREHAESDERIATRLTTPTGLHTPAPKSLQDLKAVRDLS